MVLNDVRLDVWESPYPLAEVVPCQYVGLAGPPAPLLEQEAGGDRAAAGHVLDQRLVEPLALRALGADDEATASQRGQVVVGAFAFLSHEGVYPGVRRVVAQQGQDGLEDGRLTVA